MLTWLSPHQHHGHRLPAQGNEGGLGLRHVADPPVRDDHDHRVVRLRLPLRRVVHDIVQNLNLHF